MSTGEWIFLAVSAVIFLFGVWAFLPRAVFMAAPAAISSRYREDDKAGETSPGEVRKLIDRMRDLGFQVQGVLVEKSPLWGKSIENIVLTKSGSNEYAAVVQRKKSSFYYFQTVYQDGRLVVTAESNFKNIRTSRLYQDIVSANNTVEVLDIHRLHVEEFSTEGEPPCREYTPEILKDTTHLYYNLPESRRGMRRFGSISFIILIILSIPLILSLT